MDGPIKIGCSKDPQTRLALYMCWAPIPLEVVALLPGDYRLEQRFHARFLDQHTHHEWFSASPALTATIAAIRAGIFDIDTLPAGRRLRHLSTWPAESKESMGLLISYNARTWARGISAPSGVRAAADGLYRSRGAERQELVALIRTFLADPFANGATVGHDGRWAAYQERVARGQKRAA